MDSANTQVEVKNEVSNIGTGRIYGDTLGIKAGTLLNDAETINGKTTAATLAARQQMDIGVEQLNNTNNALIYSGGDMTIAGDLNGDKKATGTAQKLLNNGSTIEAAKSLRLDAQDIQNLNRDLSYQVDTIVNANSGKEYVTPVGIINASQTSILNNASSYVVRGHEGSLAYHWSPGTYLYVTDPNTGAAVRVQNWVDFQTDIQVLTVTSSNPGKIISGTDMALQASTTLLNDMSQIIAGGNISVTGQLVENRQRTENTVDHRHGTNFNWEHKDYGCGNIRGCNWELDAGVS